MDQSSSRVEVSPTAQGYTESRAQASNTVIIRPTLQSGAWAQPAGSSEAPVGWRLGSGSHPEARLLGDPLPASRGGGHNSLPEAVRLRGGLASGQLLAGSPEL